MTQETTLATVWQILLKVCDAANVDRCKVLAQIGVTESFLQQPNARLPSQLGDIAFTLAMEQADHPAFGLRGARCWHPSNLGTLGYAWLSCSTLRCGLRRIERYARILGNRFTYTCIDERDGLRFLYDHGRGCSPIGWPLADFTLSILIDMCRTNFGSRLSPTTVRLRRPVPQDRAPYLDFFGGEVLFGQAEDSFLIDTETVDRILPTANHAMAAALDAILVGQLQELCDDDLVTRCRTFLLQTLTSGEPSEADLATAMGLSRRSLQRRLCDLGWSYKRVLDDTRANLARRYLANPRHSLSEISFLLGFSEQSAFSRAFRRWHGMSPNEYRAQCGAGEKTPSGDGT